MNTKLFTLFLIVILVFISFAGMASDMDRVTKCLYSKSNKSVGSKDCRVFNMAAKKNANSVCLFHDGWKMGNWRWNRSGDKRFTVTKRCDLGVEVLRSPEGNEVIGPNVFVNINLSGKRPIYPGFTGVEADSVKNTLESKRMIGCFLKISNGVPDKTSECSIDSEYPDIGTEKNTCLWYDFTDAPLTKCTNTEVEKDGFNCKTYNALAGLSKKYRKKWFVLFKKADSSPNRSPVVCDGGAEVGAISEYEPKDAPKWYSYKDTESHKALDKKGLNPVGDDLDAANFNSETQTAEKCATSAKKSSNSNIKRTEHICNQCSGVSNDGVGCCYLAEPSTGGDTGKMIWYRNWHKNKKDKSRICYGGIKIAPINTAVGGGSGSGGAIPKDPAGKLGIEIVGEDLVLKTDEKERVKILKDGDVHIINNLKVNLDIAADKIVATSFATTSDRRLKNHVRTIHNAIDKIMGMRGVSYFYNADAPLKENRRVGLIAQEVRKVVPEAVVENENGFMAVRYADLVGVLIQGMKEQEKRLQKLEKDNRKMKRQIKRLQK